jgi:hypothetical protein
VFWDGGEGRADGCERSEVRVTRKDEGGRMKAADRVFSSFIL